MKKGGLTQMNGVQIFGVNLQDPDQVNSAGTNVMRKLKTGQQLLKLARRKSIMTMAAPGLYMYPIVMSGGIETQKQMDLAKAFQITFASTVATAYSLHGTWNREDGPQVADIVQKFHQNDPKLINANLNAVGAALGIKEGYMNADDLEHMHYAVESATIMKDALTPENVFLVDLVAWENVESGLVMESLNDIYKPYTRSEYKLRQNLDMMKSAMEAKKAGGFFDAVDGFASRVNQAAYGAPSQNNATQTSLTNTEDTYQYDYEYDKDGNIKRDADGNKIKKNVKVTKKTTKRPFDRMSFNKVERVQNMTSLEPTMVNVQIVAHGKGDASGNSGASVHNVTLCIKAMPRIVNSSVMIASMVEACQESHGIFKFLKWTKGEIKTLDKVLGITAAKKKAIQRNAKNEVKFLEQSRKRRGKGLLGRFVRNEVLPTTTIVITSFEAEKIKETCGVDLNRYEMAVRLMNKYFLLGFCIYDTEQETLKVLFDADTDWGTTSFQSMSTAVSNAKDILNQNETLRLFGRR